MGFPKNVLFIFFHPKSRLEIRFYTILGGNVSINTLLNQMKVVYKEDAKDWEEQKVSLSRCEKTVWQGSAGLDWTLAWELSHRAYRGLHQAPTAIRQWLGSNPLYIFSDYCPSRLQAMKNLYEHLDDVDAVDLGFHSFRGMGPTLRQAFGLYEDIDVECLEIIPLTLFSDVESVRDAHPNFHSSIASSSVPDDLWHATFLSLSLTFKGQTLRCSTIYIHAGNLVCFEEVLKAHTVPISIFYAKRVGGKSGSWEQIHSENSQFMRTMKGSGVEARPQIWAADCPTFTDVGDQLFGFASWYQPPWTSLISSSVPWHWIEKHSVFDI